MTALVEPRRALNHLQRLDVADDHAIAAAVFRFVQRRIRDLQQMIAAPPSDNVTAPSDFPSCARRSSRAASRSISALVRSCGVGRALRGTVFSPD
jgi:hypothetical protein